MVFKTTSTSRRAFTLVEVLISIGISGLLLAALASFTLYAAKSFAAMFNYVDLEQKSQIALDTLSREVRQAQVLTYYSSNELVFRDYDSNLLSYTWTPKSRALVRVKQGEKKVLLTECDSVNFDVWQRTPVKDSWSNYPTAFITNAKVVSVSWTCSRKMFNGAMNTEAVQTAKIVIRNR